MFDQLADLLPDEVTEALGVARDSQTTAGALAALYGDAAHPMFRHVTAVPTLDALCAALVFAVDHGDDDSATAIFAEVRRIVIPAGGEDFAAVPASQGGLWRLH